MGADHWSCLQDPTPHPPPPKKKTINFCVFYFAVSTKEIYYNIIHDQKSASETVGFRLWQLGKDVVPKLLFVVIFVHFKLDFHAQFKFY